MGAPTHPATHLLARLAACPAARLVADVLVRLVAGIVVGVLVGMGSGVLAGVLTGLSAGLGAHALTGLGRTGRPRRRRSGARAAPPYRPGPWCRRSPGVPPRHVR